MIYVPDSVKIYTSYFYQIRNMNQEILPVSTALWDPKWFHDNKGKDHIFTDKNGVINGVRYEFLSPDGRCSNLCRGNDNCEVKNPNECLFLKKYEEQIHEIIFEEFIDYVNMFIKYINNSMNANIKGIALIFHEAPDNKCSEREVIKKWFFENNYDLEEWKS